ncbi:hypothetical protein [Corynebacterium ulceribovis]|uniref:hypothetical protein n=1 Tax=Corynebacterium ulceribovis TaxID=487732 RepID=UPI0003671F5B|nr:hypothetical protein [Corynebacterium ulceribovis]
MTATMQPSRAAQSQSGAVRALTAAPRAFLNFFQDPNPRSVFSMLFGQWAKKEISDDEMVFRLIEYGRTPADNDDVAWVYKHMTGNKATKSEIRGYMKHLRHLGMTA